MAIYTTDYISIFDTGACTIDATSAPSADYYAGVTGTCTTSASSVLSADYSTSPDYTAWTSVTYPASRTEELRAAFAKYADQPVFIQPDWLSDCLLKTNCGHGEDSKEDIVISDDELDDFLSGGTNENC